MTGVTRSFGSLNGPIVFMDKHSITTESNNSIRLTDILRVDLDKEGNDSWTVRILHYPLVKDRRSRTEFSVSLPSEDAKELHAVIKKAIALKRPPHRPRNSSRRLLVIVNPFSGQQKAKELWRDEAERVLSDGQWLCEVVETTHPGHAIDIAKTIDLDKYSGILVNSGDGLVSEVFTGLLLRRDRDRALKLPVGHLPGGTSNALVAAICFACNESFSPRYGFMREAAVMAARPTYRPLRLFKAEVEGSGRVPMFMSTTWGLIADIDIESERFRWAGMIRLHIEAVLRIAQLPSTSHYRARISYIPVGDKELIRKTMLRYNAERELFGEKHFNFEAVEEYTGESQPLGHYSSIADALSSSSAPCPAAPKLPPLDQPITSSAFTVVEGEYVFACLTSLSHLGSDLPYMPSAKLDEDDIFYLTLIDWSIIKHRLEVGALMITIDGSRHLAYPCFQVIPVRACRIEPLDGCGGNVAVDGEPKGKGKAFQVESLPMSATVIGREEVRRV